MKVWLLASEQNTQNTLFLLLLEISQVNREPETGLNSCYETMKQLWFVFGSMSNARDHVLMFKMHNKDFYFETSVGNASKKLKKEIQGWTFIGRETLRIYTSGNI